MKNTRFLNSTVLTIMALFVWFGAQAQKVDFEAKETTICLNGGITLKNLSTGTFPPTTVFVWDVHQAGNPPSRRKLSETYSVSVSQPGRITVTLTAIDSVTNVEIAKEEKQNYIFVVKPPIMEVTTVSRPCKGEEMIFTAKQVGGDGEVVKYKWSVDEHQENGYSANAVFKRLFSAEATYNVYVYGKLGKEFGECSTLASDIRKTPVTITDPKLHADFSLSSTALCGGETGKVIDFVNKSTGSFVRSEWYVDNLNDNEPAKLVSTETSPKVSISSASEVSLKIISSNGCFDSVSALQSTINVYNLETKLTVTDKIPAANTLPQNKKAFCPDALITLSAGYGSFTKIDWDITAPDGASIKNTNHSCIVNSIPGTYKVKYTVSADDCPGTKEGSGSFIVENRSVIAVKDTFHSCTSSDFTIAPTVSALDSTFMWTAANLPKPQYSKTFEASFPEGVVSVVNVAPITKNGCTGKSKEVKVIVEHPYASFERHKMYPDNSLSDSISGCPNLKILFTSTSSYKSLSKDSITSYEWIYDKNKPSIATTDTFFTHVYADTGRYVTGLKVKTAHGCVDVIYYGDDYWCNAVRVGKKPSISILIDKTPICASYMNDFLTVSTKDNPHLNVLDGYFTNKDNRTRAISSLSNNCRDLSEMKSKFNFYDHDTTGVFDLVIRAEHNGCILDTTMKDKIEVLGPIVKFTPEMACAKPYERNLKEIKHVNTDAWGWTITDSKSKIQIDSLPQGKMSKVRTIDFDTSSFNLISSIKGRGDYYITMFAEKAVAGVPDGKCYYRYTSSVSVRDIKMNDRVKFKNIDGTLTGTNNQVCWSSRLLFDISETQDVYSTANWYAWTNNTIDKMIGGKYYAKSQPIENVNTDAFQKIGSRKSLWSLYDDTLKISYPNITDSVRYGVLLFGLDINSCPDSAFIPLVAYRPVVTFTSKVSNSCITDTRPFEVSYTDLSRIKRQNNVEITRSWITQGEINSFQSSISSPDSIISDTYKDKKMYYPTLMVKDAIGCRDTFKLASGVHPTSSDIRYKGPSLVCLDDKDNAPVSNIKKVRPSSWLTLDHSSSNLYSKPDSVHWTLQWVTPSKPTAWLSQKLNDTLKYSVTDPKVTTANILLETWTKDALSGEACKNEVQIPISVRSVYSKFKPLSRDIIYCAPDTILIYPIDDVTNIKWGRIINGVNEDLSINDASSNGIRFDRGHEGDQAISLQITTNYEGCDTIDVVYPVKVLSYDLPGMKIDKSTLCVGETVAMELVDGSKADGYKFTWYFGDGEVDSTNRYKTSHKYNNLQANADGSVAAQYSVTFSIDILGECNDKPEPLKQTFDIHGLAAKFDRGMGDKTLSGCVPFTVSFVNTSIGTGTAVWSFDDGSGSGDQNPTHIFTQPNKAHNVNLQLSDNQCTVNMSKVITTLKQPDIQISKSTEFTCIGTDLTLAVTANDTKEHWWSANKYFKDTMTLSHTFAPDSSRILYLNSVSIDGCSRRDTIPVTVEQKPVYNGVKFGDQLRKPVYIADPNDTLKNYARKPWELMPFVNYTLQNDSLPGVVYSWTPSTGLNCTNCASPRINLVEDITYSVEMKNRCFTISDTVKLIVVKETKIALPTAFTPNGDGDNDFAIARGWGVREFVEMSIYNRWGQMVFHTDDIKVGWDGTYNGIAQNMDTYAYVVKLKNYDGTDRTEKGYITLIR